jgi:hypothetical protein
LIFEKRSDEARHKSLNLVLSLVNIKHSKKGGSEMQKGKFIRLSFTAIVAVVLLLAATRIEAAEPCMSAEVSAHTCFEAGGYVMRTVSPFPVQNTDGTTVFNYTLLPLPGTSKNVSLIDLLVPVCNTDLTGDGVADNAITIWTGDPNGWHSYVPGAGSSSTNFGAGITTYVVFEQSFNSSGPFYLHTTKAIARVTSSAFKIGNSLYSGTILGPDCYVPKVASTVEQVIQLDPLRPGRFITVLKDADGSLLSILDENNQPLALKKLSDSPAWVCLDPILDSSGNYLSCNGDLLPITYMPEGVGRAGKHTCYPVFYGSFMSTRCY